MLRPRALRPSACFTLRRKPGKKDDGNKQSLVGGVTANGGIDFSTGSIQQTGRALDVAIDGDCFPAGADAAGCALYPRGKSDAQ